MRDSLLLAMTAAITAVPLRAQAPSDSAAAVATVSAFHAALARADSATVLALLADDAVVLESGGLESRSEYRAHHMPADIRFAQALPGTRTLARVTVEGNVAWVVTTSETSGTFQERQVSSAGVELMVLSRQPTGWKIRAIHWSSRARRQAR